MATTTTTDESRRRSRAAWRSCLVSAFRTALACVIVGVTTLYGPPALTRQVAFPAFSYVTVILVVTDATVGDTLRACWLALYATIQSTGPAMLTLWLIGPARLTCATTALAVALAAFVVVLPRGTHLLAKRIALGQIVITYVIAFINGEKTQPIMHPVHVAASTAVGIIACLLALLLPYPRLACFEVKDNCKLFADNASERLKLFVKAYCAEDTASALASISQARCLALSGAKFLQSVKRYQESMRWERLPFKLVGPQNPGDKLQDIEVCLRGMEMALTTTSSFPANLKSCSDDARSNDGLHGLEEHITQTLKQLKSGLTYDSVITVPESNADYITNSIQTLQTTPPTHNNLPSFFFLFCMKLLHAKSISTPITHPQTQNDKSVQDKINDLSSSLKEGVWSMTRFLPAIKFSFSLGLAVLLGSMYSKENGFWSGLPVAISFAASREATFKVSNIKAQGTVLGTVYGVLGCFLFERFLPVRFLSLLPWFIFTDFLRRSHMYGQAGGISAVIGAVLILGRKNFGPPSEFAIARIVETFIGLSCSILAEVIFEPTRAATMAKAELYESLVTLHECTDSVSLRRGNKALLLEKQKRLKTKVAELAKFIGEADVEPNFWFLPFHGACYGKLLGSLSRIADVMLFCAHAVGDLDNDEVACKLNDDVASLTKIIGSNYVACFEEVISVKSVAWLEREMERNNASSDVELGKSTWSHDVEEEMERHVNGYLQHAREVVEKSGDVEGVRCQVALSLGAIGFCMSGLAREIKEIEKGISELVQWENPSTQINLRDMSCKIRALYKI